MVVQLLAQTVDFLPENFRILENFPNSLVLPMMKKRARAMAINTRASMSDWFKSLTFGKIERINDCGKNF